MKITCTKCCVSMKIQKVGVFVVDYFLKPPQPYRIWKADLYRCSGCECETAAVSPSTRPYAEHFQPDFTAKLEKAKASGMVIDNYEQHPGLKETS